MVLAINLGVEIIHDARVSYDHSCGNICPGDSFTEDTSKVTCSQCKEKFQVKENMANTINREHTTDAPRPKKKNIGKWLRSMGFDESHYVRYDGGYWKPKCSQCEVLVIQGIPCHETGCPNQVKDENDE